MHWTLLPITLKQQKAIRNMAKALGLKVGKVKTRGTASLLIADLKNKISGNIERTGYKNKEQHYNR